MDDRVPFVDAHFHLWDLSHLRYGWLAAPFDDAGPNGSVEAIASNYLIDDYLAELADWNVVGAVHVEAGAAPDQALEESRWLEAVARTRKLPNALVAFAQLEREDAQELLAAQAALPHVRGIRQIVNWHPDPRRSYTDRDLTHDPRWRRGFALLDAVGLSFDLQCYPAQMPDLAILLRSWPGVPVIINHLGMPVISDPDGSSQWRTGLAALAELPNVAVKLSGLGFIDRQWTAEMARPFLREAVDLFGPERCMFASDVPTDRLFAPADRYLRLYKEFAAQFSLDERRDMFGRNANRIYRLGLEL